MTRSGSPGGSLAATGRATLVLAGGAVIVQGIGLLRQLFLAAEVGIATALDALLIALAMPAVIVAVLTSGLVTAMVPAYIDAKEERGTLAARRLAGVLLMWVLVAGLVSGVILWLAADVVVALTAPGLVETGSAADAVRFLRALAPLTILASAVALLQATCQAERLFRPIAVAIVIEPLIALVTLMTFWDMLGLDGLVVGTLGGAVAALAVLVVAMVVGRVAPLPSLRWRGLGIAAVSRHAAPLTVSQVLVQLNGIVDRAVASVVLPGGVSALRFGNSVVRLPFGAIRPAYRMAIYPTVVHASRGSAEAGLVMMTERLLRLGLVFFVPLAGLAIAVAPLLTAVLYDRGSFADADLTLTAHIVAASAPLIVTWTVQPVLTSALNARRKGMVLLGGGILTLAINVVLNIALGLIFGVTGVAMATTIASIVVVLFFYHRLRRLEPTLSPGVVWRTLLKASLATLPIALIVGIPIWSGWVGDDLLQRLVTLGAVGALGLPAYYGLARLAGLEEAGAIAAFVVLTLRQVIGRLTGRSRSP